MEHLTVPSTQNEIPEVFVEGKKEYENEERRKSGARRQSNIGEEARKLKKQASEMIIKLPVKHLRKIKEAKGLSSIERETQHFVGITSLHGVLRMYRSRSASFWFWTILVIASTILLIVQSVNIILLYTAHPTASQVSFLITDEGLKFPKITICNFNPIRRSYILEVNKTGDFSERLLRYMVLSNVDAQVLYSSADEDSLRQESEELEVYQSTHPNFTIEQFFLDAGFSCEENMKLCMFAGRRFDCCKYVQPVFTTMGRCQSLEMAQSSADWMRRQKEDGVEAGLQIILDSHLEEQFDGLSNEPAPVYANSFENGFRFFVDSPNAVARASSQGTSVSPGDRVYSALTANRYSLLSRNEWGNCTEEWPKEYTSPMPYTSKNCLIKCKAKYFNDHCGCSPAVYNIDREYPACHPLELFICIKEKIVQLNSNGEEDFHWPDCHECSIECERWEYTTYNSYGNGFSNGALKWLNSINPHWTTPHIRANFLTINIFFRDMLYMEFTQVQATTLTQALSNMGGNLGMFLGMSVITVIEAVIFITKVAWLAVSKKRRQHMLEKKMKEEEKSREMEEAVKSYREMSTANLRNDAQSKKSMAERFRRWTSNVGSMRKNGRVQPTPYSEDEPVGPKLSVLSRISKISSTNTEERDTFMERFLNCRLNESGGLAELPRTDSSSTGSMLELKLDMNELEGKIEGEKVVEMNVEHLGRRKLRTRTQSEITSPINTEEKPRFVSFYLDSANAREEDEDKKANTGKYGV